MCICISSSNMICDIISSWQTLQWAPVLRPKTSKNLFGTVFFFRTMLKINSRIWFGPVHSNVHFEDWVECNTAIFSVVQYEVRPKKKIWCFCNLIKIRSPYWLPIFYRLFLVATLGSRCGDLILIRLVFLLIFLKKKYGRYSPFECYI